MSRELIKGSGRVARRTRRKKRGMVGEGDCLILRDDVHPTRKVKVMGSCPAEIRPGDKVYYASNGERVSGYLLARYESHASAKDLAAETEYLRDSKRFGVDGFPGIPYSLKDEMLPQLEMLVGEMETKWRKDEEGFRHPHYPSRVTDRLSGAAEQSTDRSNTWRGPQMSSGDWRRAFDAYEAVAYALTGKPSLTVPIEYGNWEVGQCKDSLVGIFSEVAPDDLRRLKAWVHHQKRNK